VRGEIKHPWAKWRNGEMAKWRNGEMAKWRNGEMQLAKLGEIGYTWTQIFLHRRDGSVSTCDNEL